MSVITKRQTESVCQRVFACFWSENRRYGFFTSPVPEGADYAPDYYTIIKNPMDLETLYSRMNSGMYTQDLQGFMRDTIRILDNATLYNPPTHVIHQEAERIRRALHHKIFGEVGSILDRQGKTLTSVSSGDHRVMEVALILSDGFYHGRL